MSAKDNMGEQFRLIHHFSDSADPPHLVDHPVFGGPNALQNVRPERQGANDTIFGTEEDYLSSSFARRYKHTYKVPESAISPEIYADDDESAGRTTSPEWQKRPQLWQQVPASRLDALKRKQVIRFANRFEAVVGEDEKVLHSLSYILPKPHLRKLGITYEGVEQTNSYSQDRKLEPGEVIRERIRKSYGKDAI